MRENTEKFVTLLTQKAFNKILPAEKKVNKRTSVGELVRGNWKLLGVEQPAVKHNEAMTGARTAGIEKMNSYLDQFIDDRIPPAYQEKHGKEDIKNWILANLLEGPFICANLKSGSEAANINLVSKPIHNEVDFVNRKGLVIRSGMNYAFSSSGSNEAQNLTLRIEMTPAISKNDLYAANYQIACVSSLADKTATSSVLKQRNRIVNNFGMTKVLSDPSSSENFLIEAKNQINAIEDTVKKYLHCIHKIKVGDKSNYDFSKLGLHDQKNPKVYYAVLALKIIKAFKDKHYSSPFHYLNSYKLTQLALYRILERNNKEQKIWQGNRFAEGFAYKLEKNNSEKEATTATDRSTGLKEANYTVVPLKNNSAKLEKKGYTIVQGLSSVLGMKPNCKNLERTQLIPQFQAIDEKLNKQHKAAKFFSLQDKLGRKNLIINVNHKFWQSDSDSGAVGDRSPKKSQSAQTQASNPHRITHTQGYAQRRQKELVAKRRHDRRRRQKNITPSTTSGM